jgi:hypothetical protein
MSSAFRSPPAWSGNPVEGAGPVKVRTSAFVEVTHVATGDSWRVTPRPGDGAGTQLLKEMTTDLASLSPAVGTDAEGMAGKAHDTAFWMQRREEIEAATSSAG